jgi:hypothetical protein
MAHILPVKIECRHCLGDGVMKHGYSRPYKFECPVCKGAKHVWISPVELRNSDVVLKR